MGNYKRIYGNGIFVTKLNAKELILKKINADTNWVDIYTSAFVLGEDLNTIGSFMISPEISELISKYSSSLFDPDASFETKIQFIEKNISEADTEEKVRAYTELLERVKIAEELRILGKILKINQGMPTNTADFYEYISKIEYYIESRLNKRLIDKYNGVRNLTSAEWIGRKKYYDTTVFPYTNAFKLLKGAIKKYGYPYEIKDLLNSDKTELIPELEKAVTTFEDTMRSLGYVGRSYWKDYKAVQEAYTEWYEDLGKVINELKENWKKFSIVRFVKDDDYAQTTISEYESTKVKFNILDVLKSLPHFNKMYKVLALNDRVLTVLSKRNEIESKVWQKAIHKYSNGNADILMNTPNKSERKILKSLIDDTLIQTWLTTGLTDFYLSSPDGTRLDFDGNLSISKLKSFIETSIIPRLRNNKFIINGQNIDTKSNEFVRRLTFGKHNGESIFKLPFNMSEIDSNPGIKQEYEKILQAFGELRNIHLEGGLTIVDVFYLYNLIVHKDHFGRNSLTRLFEDLISSKDGEKLLVFKFNEWLETVNENEIIDKVLSSWGASHRNDLSSTGNSTQIYISTNPLNKSIMFYSGGANGSDSAWGMYLRRQGFIVKDFTVDDWRALSTEQKGYYEQLYQAAINLIGTEGWPVDSYAGELTRRDMMQADSATSIFAIGTLSNSGKVNGGTKYATYAAISQGKPVYLFNLNNNSWYWYDYNSSSFIRMNDKPNLISGAAVIGTRDDKSKTGAEALRASGHEAIKDIIDRSLKLSAPKTRTVKYTPKGQPEQTYTIIGNKIYNKKGEEVYTTDSKHRRRIFANFALSEGRAVMISYNGTDYIINNRNQILSTKTNDIMQWPDNHGDRIAILERAKEEFAKLSNQSSPRVEIYQGYWTREEVESQTDKVFLFGDNTDDRVNTHYVPSVTQAVIRGLPNAIGIDTKKNRGTSENSYFTDVDFDIFKAQVDEAIQRAIDSDKTIVIPADGIGTGKAELEKRAPKLFAYFQQRLNELKSLNSSSPVQLSLNFGENDDPERFNTAEESVTVLESPKTILSNSELQLWSHVTNPKILVASEHSDPAFHTKKILEVINGTRNVTDWKGNNFTGSQFDGLYIITKHDGLPIRKLLETKIPKLIHFSITTLGGTKYEPGVMKYNDLLDRIAEYIKLGLDPNTITIRIDPIVPGETKWEDIETVMCRSAEMGIKRIKFSIMDAYPNTIKAMTELGYNFETYYETKTNFTVNGQYQFHAKAAVQKDFATRMLQLAQKYNLELHTCAEPLVLPGILHEGCLSVNAVNEMLGTHIEDKGYDNNKSRQLCSCFGGKIDVLKYGDHCSSHCIYCYAKHETDRAMQYYNEDGTLKRNAFTDIYWDGQYNIEDISEESVAEEPVTIGFDNTVERIDNETDFSITQDEVESILSTPKVIPTGQYKYIQSLAGKQFSSTEAAVIYYVLEIAKLDPNTNFEILSKIDKAQQEILNGLNSDQIAELFEVATKDLKMSEWNKDLMTKLNLGMLELTRILTDIVEDSLHIDSDYIAEREKILRNAPRNSEGQLLAPNGKVSKLSEEQWVTVRTKAFKEWFGDWELFANIPEELLNQVSLVYERIPELAQIGTPVEYAAYLQSIFPNSKDKSIYWHGSDSDFSRGFDSAVKGKGSGSPHIAGEFYLAKQAWTVLQYVSGVNRIFGPDINGFNHWNKLWWELKEIMSNGRRHNNAWKDLVIGPENVRQGIPNKRGVFNRDSGGTNGKWLKERKADYGYQDRSDEEFFRDVFGIEYGKDTFNTWTQRNAEIFRSLEKTAKGIYPAIINATNPIRETGQNTYYEPERGLLTRAILNKNDAILGSNTDNEFNSDVAVVFNAAHNVHFLGTNQDIEAFKLWLQTNRASKVIDTETGEPMVVYHGTQQKFNQFNSEFIFTSNSEPIAAGYAFQLKGISSDVDYAIHDLAIHDKDSALQAIDSKIETEKKIIELGENSPFYEEGDVEKAKESLEKLYNAKKYLEDNGDIFKNLQFRIIEGFSNIKNSLIVNAKGAYWHSIIFENKKITTNQLAKIAKERGYQGVIITDVIDKGTEVITKKDYKDTSDVIILFDPNQIKSATGAHKFTSSPNIYDADPTPVYQTTPSKQSKLIEVVRQAREKGIKGLHAVSQSDLIYENIYIRSALGFVRNGEIYINVDRAGDDTVIHEFGHLYLADAKVNNRERYYELLEKVRQTKLWSDMKTWKAYANKIGSDFDEEVLATMIGDYYKSEFGIDYEYADLVKEALSLVDGGFIDLINSEILPDLGDTFITNYALSQRTATLKHKLVSDNILKENCL